MFLTVEALTKLVRVLEMPQELW